MDWRNFKIFVMVNHFTKFIWARLFPNHGKGDSGQCASNVKNTLDEWFRDCGRPERVLSDNGSEFIATIVKEFLDTVVVDESHGKPYYPQTQGAVEKMNGVLKGRRQKMVLDSGIKHPSFAQAEHFLECAVNILRPETHTLHRFKPFEVEYAGSFPGEWLI